MKNLIKNDYFIPFIVIIICTSVFLYIPYSNALSQTKTTNFISVMQNIENQNKKNKLIEKKELNNDIIYYLYSDNERYKSYFVNDNLNEVTDIYSIIKKDKKEEFNNKINELLSLKYPKFVVDAINTNATKNFYIKDNEMIIYYTNVNVSLEEKLYLTVNYNEIKDYLDITVKLDNYYVNESGYNYNPNKKTVALTFDDGPGGSKTLELVDILSENKAHATFFMVGNRMSYFNSIVTTVHNSGNEIGSHTYSHYNLKKTKINKILEQEEKTAQIYHDLTGEDLKIMRPPYGVIGEDAKNSLNMAFINWSIDPEDWRYRDVEHIKSEVLGNVNDGDIILMHDLYDTTVQAVRELLPILYSEGYQVVSVSELANIKGITLENNTIYRSFN